ncbi:hypothetical protein CI238_11815, partial [Colletotrichum incanum]
LLLHALLQVALTLSLEVFLLGLGVESAELSVALGLLLLLALKGTLLRLLSVGSLLELGNSLLTHAAHLAQDLGAEVGAGNEGVRAADEVLKDGQQGVVVVVGGDAVAEKDALAGSGLLKGSGTLNGLVRDNEVVKGIASRLDSLDKLGRQQLLGDLGAFTHDSDPVGELSMVLGKGDGDIVAIIANLLHAVFRDDSPNEVVVGALVILAAQLVGAGNRRNSKVFLAVKWVNDSLDRVMGGFNGIHEEAGDGLDDAQSRVEALGKSQLDIHERDILATSAVAGELEERLLAQHPGGILGICVGGRTRGEANGGELGLERRRVGNSPSLGLLAVEARADDVQKEDDGADSEDGALELELAERVTLMDVVPLRVGASRGLGRAAAESCAAGGSGERAGRRRRVRSTGEVCEISSPLGIGDAEEDLEPPKRPLRMLAMVAVEGDGWLAAVVSSSETADSEAASL